jgi:uncharacterized repeat protein (TIGR01451 family)
MTPAGRRSWRITMGLVGGMLHGLAVLWSPPVSAQTTTSTTTFTEICNLPGGGASTVPACPPTIGCTCPAGTSKVLTDIFNSPFISTFVTGPATIMVGFCKLDTFVVPAGTTNMDVLRQTRTTFACVAPSTIAKTFGAASISLGGTTTLTFTLTNPNATIALTGVGFTDTLPSGLLVATPNGLTGTCGGGTITAVAGSGSISLAGATLAQSASCSFAVNVTGTSEGTKNNTTSAVSSNENPAGTPATAAVVVVQATIPVLGDWAFLVLALLLALIAMRALRARRTF